MNGLATELSELKESWKQQQQEMLKGMEDVVALKKGQLELSKLTKQQVELQEELKVLSRMVKLRETEIQTLQTQLEQACKPVYCVLGVCMFHTCIFQAAAECRSARNKRVNGNWYRPSAWLCWPWQATKLLWATPIWSALYSSCSPCTPHLHTSMWLHHQCAMSV
jgi:hypothetical protein